MMIMLKLVGLVERDEMGDKKCSERRVKTEARSRNPLQLSLLDDWVSIFWDITVCFYFLPNYSQYILLMIMQVHLEVLEVQQLHSPLALV